MRRGRVLTPVAAGRPPGGRWGADVLEGHGANRLHQLMTTRHHPGDDVAVTAQILGAAVHDDVDAKLERAQQMGGEEGVVTHRDGTHLAGRLHHHPRIHHLEGGVGQGFKEYHLGGGRMLASSA